VSSDLTLSPCRTEIMYHWSIHSLVSSPWVRIARPDLEVQVGRTWSRQWAECLIPVPPHLNDHTWANSMTRHASARTEATWRNMLQLYIRLVNPETEPDLWRVLAPGIESWIPWSGVLKLPTYQSVIGSDDSLFRNSFKMDQEMWSNQCLTMVKTVHVGTKSLFRVQHKIF